MIDVFFALEGEALARDHRRDLADALERALPWLVTLPRVGIHRLNVSAGGGPLALLSGRTRLGLRVPRERAADAALLSGSVLSLAAGRLRVGAAHHRELLPHGTLYAHLVAAEGSDEGTFMQGVEAELQALEVSCRAICGRHQVAEAGALQGWSLMLDGLGPGQSLRLLQAGLGPQRRLGCGLFVPHKSSAAVGTPA